MSPVRDSHPVPWPNAFQGRTAVCRLQWWTRKHLDVPRMHPFGATVLCFTVWYKASWDVPRMDPFWVTVLCFTVWYKASWGIPRRHPFWVTVLCFAVWYKASWGVPRMHPFWVTVLCFAVWYEASWGRPKDAPFLGHCTLLCSLVQSILRHPKDAPFLGHCTLLCSVVSGCWVVCLEVLLLQCILNVAGRKHNTPVISLVGDCRLWHCSVSLGSCHTFQAREYRIYSNKTPRALIRIPPDPSGEGGANWRFCGMGLGDRWEGVVRSWLDTFTCLRIW